METNNRVYIWYSVLIIVYCLTPIPLIAPAALILVILFITRNKYINKSNISIGAPFLFFVFIALCQSIFSGASSSKSFVDIFRWLLIGISIIFFSKKYSASFALAFYYFFIFTFIYCVIQQVAPGNSIIQCINSKYVSEDLILELFVPGFVRSTGFNQGPGHVGLVALAGLLTSHVLFSTDRSNKYIIILNYIMAISIIIMAAAKGAAIALLAFIVLVNFKKYGHYLLLFAAPFAALFFIFRNEVFFLFRLFQFESGSERISIWNNIIKSIALNPIFIIFGHGRVGNLADISIFDSDIVFLYATQGLIGVFMLALTVFFLSKRFLPNGYTSLGLTFVLFLAGMTNPFFTDIKFGVIYLCLLISFKDLYKNENLHYHR